jgi:peptidoglycan/LPS O-acetylase OafA/YrhL
MPAAGAASSAAPPHRGAERASRRIVEFDVMRGAAIVFVVYLHAYFSPWDVTPHNQQFAMHLIHLFGHTAVPVFFFVSAFLLSRDTTPTFREFATRKLRKIYGPLVFWMLVALVYRVCQNGGGMTPALWKALILFDVSGQYFFLVVLIVFMGGFYFLRNLASPTLGRLAAGAFVVNLSAILFYELADISDVYAYRNPAVWVFFYAFGFYAGRKWDSLDAFQPFLKSGTLTPTR